MDSPDAYFAGDGWGDFGLKPALKGNLKWYLIGIAVYPAVVVVILLSGGGLGWISFSDFSANSLVLAFGLAVVPNFFKNIFEE